MKKTAYIFMAIAAFNCNLQNHYGMFSAKSMNSNSSNEIPRACYRPLSDISPPEKEDEDITYSTTLTLSEVTKMQFKIDESRYFQLATQGHNWEAQIFNKDNIPQAKVPVYISSNMSITKMYYAQKGTTGRVENIHLLQNNNQATQLVIGDIGEYEELKDIDISESLLESSKVLETELTCSEIEKKEFYTTGEKKYRIKFKLVNDSWKADMYDANFDAKIDSNLEVIKFISFEELLQRQTTNKAFGIQVFEDQSSGKKRVYVGDTGIDGGMGIIYWLITVIGGGVAAGLAAKGIVSLVRNPQIVTALCKMSKSLRKRTIKFLTIVMNAEENPGHGAGRGQNLLQRNIPGGGQGRAHNARGNGARNPIEHNNIPDVEQGLGDNAQDDAGQGLEHNIGGNGARNPIEHNNIPDVEQGLGDNAQDDAGQGLEHNVRDNGARNPIEHNNIPDVEQGLGDNAQDDAGQGLEHNIGGNGARNPIEHNNIPDVEQGLGDDAQDDAGQGLEHNIGGNGARNPIEYNNIPDVEQGLGDNAPNDVEQGLGDNQQDDAGQGTKHHVTDNPLLDTPLPMEVNNLCTAPADSFAENFDSHYPNSSDASCNHSNNPLGASCGMEQNSPLQSTNDDYLASSGQQDLPTVHNQNILSQLAQCFGGNNKAIKKVENNYKNQLEQQQFTINEQNRTINELKAELAQEQSRSTSDNSQYFLNPGSGLMAGSDNNAAHVHEKESPALQETSSLPVSRLRPSNDSTVSHRPVQPQSIAASNDSNQSMSLQRQEIQQLSGTGKVPRLVAKFDKPAANTNRNQPLNGSSDDDK